MTKSIQMPWTTKRWVELTEGEEVMTSHDDFDSEMEVLVADLIAEDELGAGNWERDLTAELEKGAHRARCQ